MVKAGEKRDFVLCCTSAWRDTSKDQTMVMLQSSNRTTVAKSSEAGGRQAVAIFDDEREKMQLDAFISELKKATVKAGVDDKISLKKAGDKGGYYTLAIKDETLDGVNLQTFIVDLANKHVGVNAEAVGDQPPKPRATEVRGR